MEEFSPEVISQARIIVARTRFWTSDIEKLLRRWRKQINSRHFEHKEAERKYTKLYYLIGVPTTILSTVVASGVLTTFKNCNICVAECSPDATSVCAGDEYIRLVMGLLGIVSLALTAIMIFLNYGAASVDNKNASDDYGQLVREIDAIVEAPIIARGDPIISLHQIRTRFDDIVKKSPGLNSQISLEYKTVKTERSAVTSNARKTKMPDASSLAKILVDKIEEENVNEAVKLQKIEENNNYDTDEEKEVAIGMDLEKLRPGDTVEDTKRTAIEESLTRALEFELSRFYVPEEKRDKMDVTKTSGKRRKKRSDTIVIDIGPDDENDKGKGEL